MCCEGSDADIGVLLRSIVSRALKPKHRFSTQGSAKAKTIPKVGVQTDSTTAKPQPPTWARGTLEEDKEDWRGEEGRDWEEGAPGRDQDSDWGEGSDWRKGRVRGCCSGSIIFIIGCGLPWGYRFSDEAWRMNYRLNSKLTDLSCSCISAVVTMVMFFGPGKRSWKMGRSHQVSAAPWAQCIQ